jgi:hypothetical protein
LNTGRTNGICYEHKRSSYGQWLDLCKIGCWLNPASDNFPKSW